MLIAVMLAASAISQQANQPVALSRVFAKGERLQYSVKGRLKSEMRQPPLEVFIPNEEGIEYKFTTETTAMKSDGIAQIRYQRPSITEIQGETFESEEKRKAVKVGWDLQLDVSPINEILQTLDLAKDKKKPANKAGAKSMWSLAPGANVQEGSSIVGKFAGEIFRLAMFVGNLDSALDFNPKLPYDAVKPGATWKRTVGYSPQRLSGKSEKSAVQRLDYVYSYVGLVDSGSQRVHRVNVKLNLDTDASEFINQMLEMKPSESGLKSFKLKLDASIDFDLAQKTFITLKAVAQSEGSIHLEVTQVDRPLVEIKLKGNTEMNLLGRSPGG